MDELYLAGLKTYLTKNIVSSSDVDDALFYHKLRYSDQCAKYIWNNTEFWDARLNTYLSTDMRYHYTPKYEPVPSSGKPINLLVTVLKLNFTEIEDRYFYICNEGLVRGLNHTLHHGSPYLTLDSVGINSFIMWVSE